MNTRSTRYGEPWAHENFCFESGGSGSECRREVSFFGFKIYVKTIALSGLVKNFITLYSNACNDKRLSGIYTPMSLIFD